MLHVDTKLITGIEYEGHSIDRVYYGANGWFRSPQKSTIVDDVTDLDKVYSDNLKRENNVFYIKNNLGEYEWYGLIPLVNSLASTTYYDGKLVILSTNRHQYRWNGENWDDLGCIDDQNIYIDPPSPDEEYNIPFSYYWGKGYRMRIMMYVIGDFNGNVGTLFDYNTTSPIEFIFSSNGYILYTHYPSSQVTGSNVCDRCDDNIRVATPNTFTGNNNMRLYVDIQYNKVEIYDAVKGTLLSSKGFKKLSKINWFNGLYEAIYNPSPDNPSHVGYIHVFNRNDVLVNDIHPVLDNGSVCLYDRILHTYYYNTSEYSINYHVSANGTLLNLERYRDDYFNDDYTSVYVREYNVWYKLNNHGYYEKYGEICEIDDNEFIDNVPRYDGKLIIYHDHEWKWSGFDWIDLGYVGHVTNKTYWMTHTSKIGEVTQFNPGYYCGDGYKVDFLINPIYKLNGSSNIFDYNGTSPYNIIVHDGNDNDVIGWWYGTVSEDSNICDREAGSTQLVAMRGLENRYGKPTRIRMERLYLVLIDEQTGSEFFRLGSYRNGDLWYRGLYRFLFKTAYNTNTDYNYLKVYDNRNNLVNDVRPKYNPGLDPTKVLSFYDYVNNINYLNQTNSKIGYYVTYNGSYTPVEDYPEIVDPEIPDPKNIIEVESTSDLKYIDNPTDGMVVFVNGIKYVYFTGRLVWIGSRSCYGYGHWRPRRPWLDSEKWAYTKNKSNNNG